MSQDQTYQEVPNTVFRRLMSRLYPGLSGGMIRFVLIFGISLLSLSLAMIFKYFELIPYYESIDLSRMVRDLYRLLALTFLFVLGSLLFLRVHQLGWTILTGLFMSMAVKGTVMMSGNSIYKVINPGFGGLHDDINLDVQAEMILLLGLVVLLAAIMHLGAIRRGFKVSKRQIWIGWITAGLLISVDLMVKWIFDLERSIL